MSRKNQKLHIDKMMNLAIDWTVVDLSVCDRVYYTCLKNDER